MAETAHRIDIVLPYYSNADAAWPAVTSVLAQTYPHWRLVCVDDAFPGDEIERRLRALDDDRVVYVRNEQNLGVAKNFARCLELVASPHFVMLGDDDALHPRYLEVMADALARFPDVDVVQPGVRVIDESGQAALPLADRVKRLLRPSGGAMGLTLSGEKMAESLIRSDWAYFPSLVWRSDTVIPIGFDTRYDVALDYALLLEIALAGGCMLVLDDVVFDYRRHAASVSSMTAASGTRFRQEHEFFERYASALAERGWSRSARIARRRLITRANCLVEAARGLLRARPLQSIRLVREAFRFRVGRSAQSSPAVPDPGAADSGGDSSLSR